MTPEQTRPEVVQALTSALLGMGLDPLDDLPAVTAAERAAAQALVAALLAAQAGGVDQLDVGRPDGTDAEAWRTYRQILRAVDEVDD